MNDDYDVVEMDFPEYREEQPAIPDVENKSSFSEHKEEIYRRNRLIAAEEQNRLLKEEEREKAVRREKTEELYREAEEAEAYVFSRKITIPLVILLCVSLFAVVVLLNKNHYTVTEYAEASAAAAETTVLWETTVTEKVTRVTTERTRRETETEITEEETEEISETTISDEMLKTTAVREPFTEDGTSYVYNTAAMSYKFTPMYTVTQYDQTFLTIYVTVKNLTNYGYAVVPNFIIENDGDITRASVNEGSTNMRFSYVEELVGGEWVKTDSQFLSYDFDGNSLCSFKLQFYYHDDYGVFSYAPDSRTSQEYAEKTDVGFEIPLDEILKYAN